MRFSTFFQPELSFATRRGLDLRSRKVGRCSYKPFGILLCKTLVLELCFEVCDMVTPEVKSKTQDIRPTTHKKNPGTDFPRAVPLGATDRNARGQGHNAQVFSKKKVFVQKNCKFSRTFRHSPKKKVFVKFLRRLACSKTKNKNDYYLGPFSTNQKIVLSEDRVFLRTCWLGGKGLQIVSSRTPPLANSSLCLLARWHNSWVH